MPDTPLYLQVAIPSPLRTLFDYRVPDALASLDYQPGQRVRVPFGRRTAIGIVTQVNTQTSLAENKLKDVTELLDDAPALDEKLLTLYLWASDYYFHPPGMALQSSLPKAVREGKPLEIPGETFWQLSKTGMDADPDSLGNAHRQKQVLALLRRQQPLTCSNIDQSLEGKFSAILKRLAEKGLVIPAAVERQNPPASLTGQPLTMTPEQQQAYDNIAACYNSFSCHLLEGVTGSGKTEVYLHLMADIVRQGKQVLFLVPEIGLTPQTLSRLKQRFGPAVSIWHSGLGNRERFDTWLAAREGRTSIILGTRSAIFMPMKNPGLIVVDEEHDPSFKQQEGFRYSARDLAIFRSRQLDIPVLLGSATPSLESLGNAMSKRYNHHRLNLRTGNARLPEYRCVDLRGETLEEGFSPSLFSEINYHLDQNNQVLVFLNRRGYSPVLLCHHCGHIEECHRCETAFTLHRHPPSLICHHCDSSRRLPDICSSCGSTELMPVGLGTERVEQILEEHFPDYPIIRIDRDSTRRKDALQEKLDIVNTNKPCILIGTQMIAKGHHFPSVTLVAILDVDRGLFNTGLRSQEQLGQIVSQVAGRAGRGSENGSVIIQTHHVTHPLLETLINKGYGSLARQLLDERKQAGHPPYAFQALVHAEAVNRSMALQYLQDIARDMIMMRLNGLMILGPLPAPMEKRAGRFRFQLILQHAARKSLRDGLNKLIGILEQHPDSRKVRWALDVDPTDFS